MQSCRTRRPAVVDRSGSSGLRRALGGLLSLAIVAAAGYGGWIGYERFLAGAAAEATEDQSGAPDASASTEPTAPPLPTLAPWPDDVVLPADEWTSFRIGFQPDGDIIRQQIDYDATLNGARVTLFGPSGAEIALVEVRGQDAWVKQGDGDWQQPQSTGLGFAGVTFDRTEPLDLIDLFPQAIWPHVNLLSDIALTDPDLAGIRRLAFSVDTAGFSLARPVAAESWRDEISFVDADEPAEWVIDLDPAGHIVRIDVGRTGGARYIWFSELTEPVPFSSPLAR